jgi:hypothetical protein
LVGRRRGFAAAAIVALVGVLTYASAALGGNAVKGGHYTGKLDGFELFVNTGITVTFTVSHDGKKVRKLRLSNSPNYCPQLGINPTAKAVKFKSAKISKQGTFRGVHTYPSADAVQFARLTITGKFAAGRLEAGTIKVRYPKFQGTHPCRGDSHYTTKAG